MSKTVPFSIAMAVANHKNSFTHRTLDGRRIKLEDMDVQHLANSIAHNLRGKQPNPGLMAFYTATLLLKLCEEL